MAYLYRHIRLDKNEPFYIGIGSDSSKNEGKYTRSKTKSERNKIWYNIVSKTKYKIEIMLDDLSWEDACEKEKFFISFYGRKDLGKGPLCNLTDGGEGCYGYVRSKEMNEAALSYKIIPVHQYDLEGNYIRSWNSLTEVHKNLGIDIGHLSSILKGKNHIAKNYMFRYEKFDKIDPCKSYRYKNIYQYDLQDNFIKKWNSTKEAEEYFGKVGIYRVLEGKTKTSSGFKWYREKQ